MRRRARDLALVGGFVVVTSTVLVAALLWLAGANVFRRVDRYYVVFDRSVSGLAPGATVEFQGVSVGRVQAIELTDTIPPKVSVAIDVEPDTPIRKDTHAELLGSVVTGIKFIALEGGTEQAGPLEPGSVVPGQVTAFEKLGEDVAKIASRALGIVDRLDTQLFTPENNAKLSDLLGDIAVLADTLRSIAEPLREQHVGKNLAELVRQVSEAAENVDALVSELRSSQGKIVSDAKGALGGVQQLALETRDLVHEVRGELGGAGTSLTALLSDLTEATNRLEETLTIIQADPSLLLRGRRGKEEK